MSVKEVARLDRLALFQGQMDLFLRVLSSLKGSLGFNRVIMCGLTCYELVKDYSRRSVISNSDSWHGGRFSLHVLLDGVL